MSEAVKRLVGRATGQAGSRLRPRLPSRFETAATEDEGFVTRHEEVAAAPPRTQTTSGPARAVRSETETAPAPTLPPTLPPSHEVGRQRDQASPAEAPPRATDGTETGTTAPPGPHSMREAAPKTEAETPSVRPGPKDTSPAPTTPAAHPTEIRTVEPRDPPGSDPAFPPPPLLPEAQVEPDDAFAEPATESPAGPVRRTAEPRQAAQDAGPPEITIHIGRIDLRSEAAKPAKRQRRPRPESNGSSLGDYLKGGGGRR